jgi:leader peptidase (prepilin peptidase)/N-methyltransferase
LEIYIVSIVIASGAILGSFFNVCIWRIPRCESIIFPASHCPSCGRSIRPWENIPVISFIILRGKCAGCKAAISWRYPVVELLTAGLALILWFSIIGNFTNTAHSAFEWSVFAVRIMSLLILVPVALIDLYNYIIPDSITLSGIASGILLSILPGAPAPVDMALGILAGGGSLYALGIIGEVVFRKGEAMGGGDIKLMAFIGALWGWKISLLAIVFGSVLGASASIPLIFLKRLPQDRRIPFGPFLAAGTWIAVLHGEQLISSYINLVSRLFF